MKITRLSWAGLLLESTTTSLYIDPLQNVAHIAPFLGEPKFPMLPIPFAKTLIASALITHVHPDHFDLSLLRELIGSKGDIWGPDSVKNAGEEEGLSVSSVKLYETFMAGDFKITAVPAVDWVGDDQVSYIISDGKHTIIHGGDTNWHGYWWPIAKQYGPFDAAFLPINGVVGEVPGVTPAVGMFGTMTPAQAVSATRILEATILVPMHYAQFHNAPGYTQFPDLDNVLDQSGLEQGIKIRRMEDGEMIEF
ncbi:MBL fold metallo-hydrolase [Pedobacter aquatilis]|uniref:MBL fold metallo-hydrolase n=1 Tax=Pedobacter aquatilis TaxID=351343 RepID=UPI00292CF9FC|nr:MBL fold metallo-hydrolase [Pedobacter aquatilis]